MSVQNLCCVPLEKSLAAVPPGKRSPETQMIRLFFVLALASGACLLGQDAAKAMFYAGAPDNMAVQQSGKQGPGMPGKPASATSGHASTVPANPAHPRNPGLMYWIEVRTADDTVRRVSTSRLFHSGDRIRIHVQSSVDGRLSILQRQDDGPYDSLFPNAHTVTDRVVAREDTVLPSRTGWFRFDEKPGRISLLVMLVSTPSSTGGRAGNTASADSHPGQASATANEVTAALKSLEENKSLYVEDDPESNSPANYAAVRWDDPRAKGTVAAKIVLVHQPAIGQTP